MLKQPGSRLNYLWRVFATGLSFVVFGLGGATIPWLALPVIRLWPGSEREKQARARHLIQRMFGFFMGMMRFLGIMTWDVRGLDKLNRDGILVLANHPTLIDVVLLVSFLPNADCIVKSSLSANPAMRGFIAITGFIANDDGPALLEDTRSSLARGSALIVFPEGTRSEPGKLQPFRRGAANLAIRSNTPVTPVVIHCDPPTLYKGLAWHHVPQRRYHMQFTVGDDIDLAPYRELAPSVAARRLNRDLEDYFAKELDLNGQ